MCGFAVVSVNKDRNLESIIFRQPFNIAEEVKVLKEQLIEGDSNIERESYYFPHLQQALKAKTAFVRAVSSIKGLLLDLYPSNLENWFF